MLFRLVLSLIWFIHNYIIPKKARQWYQYISRHIRHKKDFLLYRFFRLIACCLIICCAPRMLFSVASCTIFSMLYEGKKKKLKILVACALRGKSPNRNLQSKLQKYCSIFDKGNSVDIRCLIWDILAWFLFS